MGYLGPFLAAALVPSFVMYGFDTAGALAEETDDPRRKAPRAILGCLAAVGLAGALLILGALRAAPDLSRPRARPARRRDGDDHPGGARVGLGPTLLLADVVLAIGVCTLTVHAAAVRLVFAMARDNGLPWSESLASLPGSSRTPRLPAVLLGLGALAILAANANLPQVVEVMASVAIAWANLAYLFVTVPQLVRRLRDRGGVAAAAEGLFSLGRWGLPINVLAVVWGVLIVVNVAWPRAEVYGEAWYRRFAAASGHGGDARGGLGSVGVVVGRREAGVLEDHRAPVPGASRRRDVGNHRGVDRMMSSRADMGLVPVEAEDEGGLDGEGPGVAVRRRGASTSTRRSAWSWRPGWRCSWSEGAPRRSARRSS